MALPPNSTTAYANSLASLTTIQTAADDLFISDAAEAIAQANALGKYFVVLTTTKDCNILAIQTYFTGLGYHLFYLDLPNPSLAHQPAELFGQFWFCYWSNNCVPPYVRNPQRIRISWNPQNICIYPYP